MDFNLYNQEEILLINVQDMVVQGTSITLLLFVLYAKNMLLVLDALKMQSLLFVFLVVICGLTFLKDTFKVLGVVGRGWADVIHNLEYLSMMNNFIMKIIDFLSYLVFGLINNKGIKC